MKNQQLKSALPKYDRALKVLQLMGKGMSVPEIAKELDRPISTIYKHHNALRHLMGKEGMTSQNVAFNALYHVRSGKSQREVARSVVRSLDHKFISDLCAMDWAIRTMLGSVSIQALTDIIELGLRAESRDRTAIREPVAVLTEAFDTFLCLLPDVPLSPELEAAITDLTEAVIELESRLG